MSIPFSIQTYIQYGQICSFLAANDQNNFVKNPGGTVVPDLSRLIYDVTTSIEWGYAQDPTDVALVQPCLYLYELCGKYIRTAQGIIGMTGGTVIIPGGTPLTLRFDDPEFIVAASGTPVIDGGTVWTLTYNLPIVGSLDVFVNSQKLPIGLTGRLSYTAVYTSTTIVVTFNQGLFISDLVQAQLAYYS